MNDSRYLIALQFAADAGDAESQYEIAQHHLKRCSFTVKANGAVGVLGGNHWRSAQLQLSKALQAGNPNAWMLMGSHLFNGHPVWGRRVLLGAMLWMRGWLKKRTTKSSELKARLLTRAKLRAIVDSSARSTYSIPFLAGIGSSLLANCKIRISVALRGDCHIVIEQVDSAVGPSITNSVEQIATTALYRLWLDGIDLSPEEIHWYEAYPAGSEGMHPEGSVVGVQFEWDGTVYHHPCWLGRPKHVIPIDLSDMLTVEGV